jgi:hypothetical protein
MVKNNQIKILAYEAEVNTVPEDLQLLKQYREYI